MGGGGGGEINGGVGYGSISGKTWGGKQQCLGWKSGTIFESNLK